MFFIRWYFVALLPNAVIRFHFTFHLGRLSLVLQIFRDNYCEVILDVFIDLQVVDLLYNYNNNNNDKKNENNNENNEYPFVQLWMSLAGAQILVKMCMFVVFACFLNYCS